MNQERHDEISDAKHGSFDRRQFLASTAAIGALPVLINARGATAVAQDVVTPINSTNSIIGGYGS